MENTTDVRQLRVVVSVQDYDSAVRFYRDVLGLPEVAAFAEGGDDRVAILDAGRATLEIASPTHAQSIDAIEAGGLKSPQIRLAFEVGDTRAWTADLAKNGASVVAHPVLTPWRSINSRLDAPGELVITLFEETETEQQRSAHANFGRDNER